MLTATIFIIACAVAADDCHAYGVEEWQGPTPADVVQCATLAASLQRRGALARCEVGLTADTNAAKKGAR